MQEINTPALPDKKYNIIYADPPWTYKDKASAGNRGAGFKYDLMTDAEIYDLPVQDIAADDCILFMWATYPKIQEALNTIKAWGFTYKTIGFQWIKENKSGTGHFMGMGRWTRANSEPCLVATRGDAIHIVLDEEDTAPCLIATKGKPKRINAGVRQLIFSPLRSHSQKPDETRDRIVALMGDLPRIELFARSAAEGWDCWGNEAPKQEQESAEEWMQ